MFIIFLLIFNYWSGTVCSVFRIWNLNLCTFVAKYWCGDLRTFWRKILKARFTCICRKMFMPGFTHFFCNFFLTEKAVPQTFSLLECMLQELFIFLLPPWETLITWLSLFISVNFEKMQRVHKHASIIEEVFYCHFFYSNTTLKILTLWNKFEREHSWNENMKKNV